MGFIESVMSLIDGATAAMAATAFDAIASQLIPVFRVMAILLITLVGTNLAIQAVPMTLQNGVSLIARIGLVAAFLSSWSNFDSVYGVLTNAPSEVGGTIMASLGFEAAVDGLYAGLDQLYEGSVNAGNAVAQNGSFIAGAIASVVVFLVAVFFSVICVVVLGMAKIVIALMIVLAPAALLCTMFKPTTGIFEGWLRATIQAALIPLMMAAAAGVVLVIAQDVAPTDMASVSNIGDLLGFMFVMMLGSLVILKVPGISETLASANLGIDRVAHSLARISVSGSGQVARSVTEKGAHTAMAAVNRVAQSPTVSRRLNTVQWLASRSTPRPWR
ncbi:type IV secretion system protein [Aliiroseovarius sp. S1339]|uniref:type IV secretion system protein n=1 Tax=Aliiroseovarius sp. S1339 TaxID=2936990 RepID=UPI0020C06864|nr:type IV secretion system protein [Aliiroseovarius sp. S1339]MCK8463016.1 type IV secretion system protein [Aliiroseovarius sp. S1339]